MTLEISRTGSKAAATLIGMFALGGQMPLASAQAAAPPHVAPTIQMSSHVLSPIDAGRKSGPIFSATTAAAAANGITYNGGPVMLGTVHVYLIWYGNWAGDSSTTILPDLAAQIGGSPYYNINTTYYDSAGNHVSNSVSFAGSTTDSYSHGTSLTDAAVQAVVSDALSSGRLPIDTNGVYFVVTSPDVRETSGFCTSYCGWHTHASLFGSDIKYSFVGDAAQQCPSACTAQQGSSPNGNIGADGMASVLAHELEEAATDPDLNAWHNAGNSENADLCAWTFGSEYTAPNGSRANMRLGSRDYLIQQNWVNADGGHCALSYASLGAPSLSTSATYVRPNVPYTLSWTVPAGAINHYTLDKTASGSTGHTDTVYPASTTSVTLTSSVPAGLTKFLTYQLRACSSSDEALCSAWSNSVVVEVDAPCVVRCQ